MLSRVGSRILPPILSTVNRPKKHSFNLLVSRVFWAIWARCHGRFAACCDACASSRGRIFFGLHPAISRRHATSLVRSPILTGNVRPSLSAAAKNPPPRALARPGERGPVGCRQCLDHRTAGQLPGPRPGAKRSGAGAGSGATESGRRGAAGGAGRDLSRGQRRGARAWDFHWPVTCSSLACPRSCWPCRRLAAVPRSAR